MENIRTCTKCELCNNQTPLIDNYVCGNTYDIIWCGLSAKKKITDDEVPLSPHTNSGKIIALMEEKIKEQIKDISFYKTNVVKCVPLSDNGKLRYPTKEEMKYCISNFEKELKAIKPQIVFLLGDKVTKFVEKHFHLSFINDENNVFLYAEKDGMYFISIWHPSYLYIYKKNQINEYTEKVTQFITAKLKIYHTYH